LYTPPSLTHISHKIDPQFLSSRSHTPVDLPQFVKTVRHTSPESGQFPDLPQDSLPKTPLKKTTKKTEMASKEKSLAKNTHTKTPVFPKSGDGEPKSKLNTAKLAQR
jgi:hypothetical protein